MVTNPFIRLDAARSAMPPYRASAGTTPGDVFGPAKPGFLRPLEQRYAPLVVDKTTAWNVPCQQTQKAGQTSQRLLSLV